MRGDKQIYYCALPRSVLIWKLYKIYVNSAGAYSGAAVFLYQI